MLMTDLLRSVGIPAVTRNLMVEYCDSRGTCFHRPIQTIMAPAFHGTDKDLIEGIQTELKKQGCSVRCILEAFGEFELEELEDVFNGSRQGEHSISVLYLDAKLAQELMREATDMPGKG